MESWPASLPQIPYYKFDTEQVSGLNNPGEQLYPVRTRTYPEHDAQFTFKNISVSQFQAFRTWWNVTINQCAAFTAPWLEAAGFDHHFCRFDTSNPWEVSLDGLVFILTINVEIISGVPMDGEEIDYYRPLETD